MFDSLTVHAPAKINLGLTVLPERGDGYHNIKSIFTTVSLADEISVALNGKKNTCLVSCEGMVLPQENTFTASYKAFCVLTGCDYGCSVKVTKHIPSGGGLGGGSSDASSFIQSIDTLCGTHLSSEALVSLAEKVGSDVFFFTKALLEKDGGGSFAAIVTGRGETVKKIAPRRDYSVVLVFPGVSVSTKEAYLLVDKKRGEGSICAAQDCCAEVLEAQYRKPVRDWNFKNDFTVPVCERYGVIKEALEALRNAGADFADMSGSGTTVFGIFEERDKALQAQGVLASKWESVIA